ncbi:phosphoribosylamine--glycine ligase [Gramella sp. AN32]|uniref:Phosphoribosylamine--glycine ligase n=1 Tax=Christiangramia antarctica TaxID=2058158 RepID=A0ABW5X2N9_9FLAO|nr:phosphoribosylamine--glycine ligase [Gramella sp. AN32]MCM4155022.1 phosphoribosylamine--glycine ligase [Gramella sp. AN32]
MNILILGSGGREHTFAYNIVRSDKCEKLYVAPGNAGTGEIAENLDVDPMDFAAVAKTALEKNVHMIVVGPEDPLVKGIVDYFIQDEKLKDIMIIGPDKRGALLEGSKERAKEFMALYNIPTAAYESFSLQSLEAGYSFLEKLNPPYVLKADGLAGGKGVLILDSLSQAKIELKSMLSGKFGSASDKVVIEEFLDGIELSVFVLTDGENYQLLPTAKDYKRIGEGDKGLNTGGMGAVSPVPFADVELMQKIEERIVKPTVNGIKEEGINYKGFVFIGIIKVQDEPYVIEYNVRMGDPETEVVFPRIKTDLIDLLEATWNKTLNKVKLEIDERAATTVMTVSGGYPGSYEKGKIIEGIETIEGSIVFHAGTRMKEDKIVTNGGRVIAITSFGKDYKEALKKSYQNADKLHFDKMYFRKDIGFDLS